MPINYPQAATWLSEADETFAGGAAGGGKSWTLLGLAMTAHTRSLILRVEATNLQQLKDDLMSMVGPMDHWRSIGYGGVLDTADGRKVELSGCDGMQSAEKYRGRAHDLKCWDEVCQFPEAVFRFVNAWCRTGDPDQRCRVVATGNPPARPEEEWVIKYWGPWLDGQHPNPAEPGELRWFASISGEDKEVESGEPFYFNGERIQPRSRTFIPARLEDNPILEATGYRAALQGLPEPLRSQLLYGDMAVGRDDDEWQVLPTRMVRAAMRRWKNERPDGRPDAGALDVAMGGCFDGETEILTDGGWKLFRHLKGDERVLTLRGDTAEWGPITHVHQYWHDGPMNVYDTDRVSFSITDNHNLLVRTYKTPERSYLERYDRLPRCFIAKRTNRWSGTNPERMEFSWSRKMPHGGEHARSWSFDFLDWAEFLGWFISEGCAYFPKKRPEHPIIIITQNRGPKLDRIKALLGRMGIRYGDGRRDTKSADLVIHAKPIALHLIREVGQGAANKRIPTYMKEAGTAAIDRMLESLHAGDGSTSNTGTRSYVTSSLGLANDIQEVLAKVGRAGKMVARSPAGSVGMIGDRQIVRNHTTMCVNEKLRPTDLNVTKDKVRREHYTGFVWCVSTPLKTIMVRRHGITMWSGNSDRMVLAKRYGRWVAPLQAWKGREVADGNVLVKLVLPHLDWMAMPLLVDMLANPGGEAVRALKDSLPTTPVRAVNFGSGSSFRDKSGRLEMFNLRAEAYWRLKEAIETDAIDLPDDPELLTELCAVRWKPTGGKVQIEKKEDIRERLGRSTDKADAVAMLALTLGRGSGGWLAPRDPKPAFDHRPGRPMTYLGGGGSFMGVGGGD